MNYNLYELEATDIQGRPVPLNQYKGKVLLIVNTATQCGFTPQLEGLEKLYQKYKSKGLVVMGFPTNQFAKQEPGDNDHIAQVCQINYGVTFPMFSKTKVNGSDAHPLFKYLKKQLRGLLGSRIKWNFTKFLVDKEGRPVKRFAPTTKPEKIGGYIEKHLGMGD